MLIKFFGGAGSGGGIAKYLVDPERAGREDAAPEVVRGDIEQTRELIDSTDRKWTYSTGVISFAPEDRPTEAQQDALMDDFERLAFAGLKRDQYDITWVRHSHTSGGRVELHFLTPRTELSSGKAFNIAPPGWERSYAPLRDANNFENGWARPDDPQRSRTLHWTPQRADRGEAREAITAYLESAIITGQISDRDGIVSALNEAGYETPRLGKNYITALNPETGERWRLKGRIYEKDWTRDEELDRTTARDGQAAEGGDRGGDPRRAANARERLEAVIQRRARWVESDILSQLSVILSEVTTRRMLMNEELAEIRKSPRRLILSSVAIAATITAIFWSGPSLWMMWQLGNVTVQSAENGTFLILPPTAQTGWTCGGQTASGRGTCISRL